MGDDEKIYLSPMFENIRLGATDGTQTLWKAEKIFGYRDSELEKLDVPGKAKPFTLVAVCKIIKDCNFRKVCESSGLDLNSLCLEQSQIVKFCQKYPHKLGTGVHSTFFLFTLRGEPVNMKNYFNLYVATVSKRGGLPKVYVYRFLSTNILRAQSEHRLVCPQLKFLLFADK